MLVRCFDMKGLNGRLPHILCFVGKFDIRSGRARQFHQFGVELLGSPVGCVDAELIQLAADLLWHTFQFRREKVQVCMAEVAEMHENPELTPNSCISILWEMVPVVCDTKKHCEAFWRRMLVLFLLIVQHGERYLYNLFCGLIVA